MVLVLSPENMLFCSVTNMKHIIKYYKFSDITHWFEADEEFFIIKTKDDNKHVLVTPYFMNIKYYIQFASELIKKQDKVFYQSVVKI